jgi:hypothetical protein
MIYFCTIFCDVLLFCYVEQLRYKFLGRYKITLIFQPIEKRGTGKIKWFVQVYCTIFCRALWRCTFFSTFQHCSIKIAFVTEIYTYINICTNLYIYVYSKSFSLRTIILAYFEFATMRRPCLLSCIYMCFVTIELIGF